MPTSRIPSALFIAGRHASTAQPRVITDGNAPGNPNTHLVPTDGRPGLFAGNSEPSMRKLSAFLFVGFLVACNTEAEQNRTDPAQTERGPLSREALGGDGSCVNHCGEKSA